MSTETFTGTDGAAWPTGWTTSTGGTKTIQTNKGRIVGGSGAFGSAIWTTPAAPDEDFEFALTAKRVSGSGDIRIGVGAAANEWSTPNTGYTLKLTVTSGGALSYGSIKRHSSGQTELTFADLSAISPGTDGWAIRIKRTAGLLQARVWAAGATEPTTWNLSATDASPLTVDLHPWLGVEGTGFTVDFDTVDFTTGTTGGGGGGTGGGTTTPDPASVTLLTDGTDQATALQGYITARKTAGGGGVRVFYPGKTIKLNSTITIPEGVWVESDGLTVFDHSALATTTGVGWIVDDHHGSRPLRAMLLKGPSGDPRSTPTNTTDISTAVKVSGQRITISDVQLYSWGRGYDWCHNNTWSIRIERGDISLCRYPIWADYTAASITNSGEALRVVNTTIYNNVHGPRATGNGISLWFEGGEQDFMLTDFGSYEDAWVRFIGTHIETGNTPITYLFDLDKNAHVEFVGANILMGASGSTPNQTLHLVNPAKAPWNPGFGKVDFSPGASVFFVDKNGANSQHYGADYVVLPAGQTTVNFEAPMPKRWCMISAEFASSDASKVSEFDQVYVSWASGTDNTFTLTASAAKGWNRVVRVRY